jgi:hypothetical protein
MESTVTKECREISSRSTQRCVLFAWSPASIQATGLLVNWSFRCGRRAEMPPTSVVSSGHDGAGLPSPLKPVIQTGATVMDQLFKPTADRA